MKQKEYPMDEEFNRAAAFLAEMIAEREGMVKDIKLLPPDARPEALRLLAEFDKAIEEREQKLAEEYEATQKYQRAVDERDKAFVDLTEGLAGSYVHIKYRHPEKLHDFEAIINNMEPDDAQYFFDRAAILESGDLIRIIAREGETREETQEFLRNFRAAEKEKNEKIRLEQSQTDPQEKEFPMDDNYNEKLRYLTEQIAERDRMRKKLIILSPKARAAAELQIAEFDKIIERCEKALANLYEAHQKQCRAEEKRDQIFGDLLESSAGMYVHVKYRLPENLPQMETLIEGFTPDFAEALRQRAAEIEATDLISFIAREGETLEETEEFLRQYRAAEKDV